MNFAKYFITRVLVHLLICILVNYIPRSVTVFGNWIGHLKRQIIIALSSKVEKRI